MAFRLSIEDGPYVQTLQVARDRLRVGKDAANDLRLASDGVSARHCTIRQDGNTLVVTDLNSKTGLFRSGRRHERLVLQAGDSIEVGSARITVVHVDGEPPVPEPEPALATAATALAAALTAPPGAAPTPAKAVPARPALEFSEDDDPLPAGRGDGPRAPAERALPTAGVAESGRETAVAVRARPAPADAHPHHERRRPPGLDEPVFADLAYQALRNSPWWLASAALHGAILLLLTLVEFSSTPVYQPIEAVVGVGESSPEILDETPDVKPDAKTELPLEEMERPEDEVLPREIREQIEPETKTAQDEADEERFAPPSAADFQDTGTSVIGLSSTAIGGGNLGSEFGKDDAATANQRAAGSLTENPFSRALLQGLRVSTNERNVRVVKGQYDQCEKIFEILGLHQGAITYDELERGMPDPELKAMLINCSGEEPGPQARRNIEAFVRRGGYLFTTDWGVDRVIERCFHGTIATIKDGQRVLDTHDETIQITVDGVHELLKGLPKDENASRWWLEDSSHPFVIRDPSRVEVLIRSADLGERWKSDLVAVTFPHGKGRVVHVIGHLFQREGNLRGAHAMQRLLLNFLYRALHPK